MKWSEVIGDERWSKLNFDERNQVRMKFLDIHYMPQIEKLGLNPDEAMMYFFDYTDTAVLNDKESVFKEKIMNNLNAIKKSTKNWKMYAQGDPGGALLDVSRRLNAVFHWQADDNLLKKWGNDLGGLAAGLLTFFPFLAEDFANCYEKLAKGERPTLKDAPTLSGWGRGLVETWVRGGKAVRPIMKYMMPGAFTRELIMGTDEETKEASKQALTEMGERPFSTLANVAIPLKIGGRVYTGTANAVRMGGLFREVKKAIPAEGKFKGSRIAQYATKEADFVKVQKRFDVQRQKVRAKTKYTMKKFKEDLVRNIYDVSGNLKLRLDEYGELGINAKVMHDLLLGTGNKAGMVYNDAYAKIFNNLSKEDRVKLGDLRQGLRTVELEGREGLKHPEGLEPEPIRKWIAQTEKQWGKETFEKVTAANDQYRMIMHDCLKRRFDEGLIDSDLYTKLVDYVDYNPREFIQWLDEVQNYDFGGKPMTVTNSGLRMLDEGSIEALVNDPVLLLQETIARTEGRIARNNANKALIELAREGNTSDWLKIEPPEGGKVPAGWSRISAMEDGTRVNVLMKNKMASEWVTTDPHINWLDARMMRILSGSAILRPMATGINPEFAATNIFRDIQHIYATAVDPYGKPVYNPLAPIAGGQLGIDIATVLPDVLGRKGIYRDYIMNGGGMEFLTMQGRPFRAQGLTREFQGIRDWYEYVNLTSELITRCAIYNRMLKKGATKEVATQTARNYLDFNQGGSMVKSLDNVFPYMNAAVQGTRGLVRMAKTNPVSFGFRIAQLQALEAGLYFANIENHPEAWKDVPEREKEANFIFCTGMKRKDKEGKIRYHYIKIPKDQGQRVFATLARSPLERLVECKYPNKEILMAAMDFLPPIIESFPPTIAASAGYIANYNFYFQDEIWKGADVPASFEYTPSTPEIYKGLGKLGISPERGRYAGSQLLTYRNVYKDLLGLGYDMLTNKMSEDDELELSGKLSKSPFIRRFSGETYPDAGERDTINKLKREENARRQTIRYELYGKLRDDDKDAAWEIYKKADREDKTWIKNRITHWDKTRDVDFRWLDLSDENPIVKARYFFDEWIKSSPEERNKLINDVRKVPRFTSDAFWRVFNKYKKDYNEANKEVKK